MICKKCKIEMTLIQNTVYICNKCNNQIFLNPIFDPSTWNTNQNPTNGPGTQLKSLLSMLGITSNKKCSCKNRALMMDQMESKEPGWCEKNIDTIVGWLKEEATKRGLPFIEIIARSIIKLAIKRAKKKANIK